MEVVQTVCALENTWTPIDGPGSQCVCVCLWAPHHFYFINIFTSYVNVVSSLWHNEVVSIYCLPKAFQLLHNTGISPLLVGVCGINC